MATELSLEPPSLEPPSLNLQHLYQQDFVQWLELTLETLRSQHYDQVDWQNLLEEIEAMGKRERKSVRSNLTVLLLHLLKWQFQPDRRSASWQSSIVEHRQRLEDDLEDSPSLSGYLLESLPKAYQNARQRAAAETGLSIATFPETCPYAIEQLLQMEFLPT
ncbi:MAG: DUF29 domain-containing protein [Synechococcales bacterium]|nr:DUF29 domain-containing protein [Synechococcales bacterium]